MSDPQRTRASSAQSTDDADETPTVAACQMAVTDLDVAANLDAVVERATDLPPETDVALFPEYALTGFVADERVRSAALARDGDALARLQGVADETGTALLVGFVEDAGEACYNAVAYLDPDGTATVYRKRHLWGGEADVLAHGNERVTVETPVGTTGLLTCYDLNFVGESAAFARREVDALFVAGAWPAAHSENWRLLLRARALDGVRWVVGAGRTGEKSLADSADSASDAATATATDAETTYAGRSLVVRPDGSVAAGLNRGERDLIADLDPGVLAECREFIPVHEDARR